MSAVEVVVDEHVGHALSIPLALGGGALVARQKIRAARLAFEPRSAFAALEIVVRLDCAIGQLPLNEAGPFKINLHRRRRQHAPPW
jgi:hypothetical protein